MRDFVFTTKVVKLPTWSLPYLINGDSTNLDASNSADDPNVGDRDLQKIDDWFEKLCSSYGVNGDAVILEPIGSEYFSHCTELGDIGDTVQDVKVFVELPLTVSFHQERDNTVVSLWYGENSGHGDIIQSWFDRDAVTLFYDGFFNIKDLQKSVIKYAHDVGIIKAYVSKTEGLE